MSALHDIVKKGSTSRSVTVRIADSTDGTPETAVVYNTAGIDLWYRREGAAKVSITEVTLAALTTAWTSGGFLHVGDGEYRLDLPDAAFATAANYVDFGGTVTGMVVYGGRVKLVDVDLNDTVRFGLTALPSAAAAASGGLFTRGTGAGAINQTANGQIDVNIAAITDAIMYKLGALDVGTAQSATSTTMVLRSAAAFADSALNGCIVIQTGGTNSPQAALVTSYVGATDTATVAAWPNGTPAGTITYVVWGTVQASSGSGLDAAATRAALGLASANLDTQIALLQADTDNIQTRIPAALVSGRMDASVGAMAANVMTAAAAASDLTTELQSGLATAASLTTAQTDLTNIKTRIPTSLVSGRMDSSVGAMAADVITAAAAATDFGTEVGTAVWATTTRVLSAGTNIALAKGTGVTGFNDLSAAQVNAEADTAISDAALATAASLAIVTGYVDTEVAAIKAVTDKLDTSVEINGGLYRFTTAALGNAPSGGSGGATAGEIADAVWDEALSGHSTAGTAGKGVTDAAAGGGGGGLDAAGVRAAVGLASANLDTQIGTLATPAQVATALNTYDAPTKAEMDAALVEVDANVKKVNDVAVSGAGSVGNPWGPA